MEKNKRKKRKEEKRAKLNKVKSNYKPSPEDRGHNPENMDLGGLRFLVDRSVL